VDDCGHAARTGITMPDWETLLFGYGPLGLFCYWLFVHAIPAVWNQLFSRDEKALGLVVAKMRASTAKDERLILFVDSIDNREDKQMELCGKHADNLGRIADLGETQAALLQAAHDSVKALVARSEQPDAPFSTVKTNLDIQRMKQAAIKACAMCRQVAATECPDSAKVVNEHCSEIERIIGES
jgi:hypothetical protein